MHIDDFLDTPQTDPGMQRVQEWFEKCRAPAIVMERGWIGARVVRCSYQGERFRCTGASRLGDVWLTRDMKQSVGYQKRVDFSDCSDWTLTHNAEFTGRQRRSGATPG